MSLPALPSGADTRSITDRLNALIRAHNQQRNPVRVDDLPDAEREGAGSRAFVTDADSATFGAVAVGGGSNAVPVWSDQAGHWRIG